MRENIKLTMLVVAVVVSLLSTIVIVKNRLFLSIVHNDIAQDSSPVISHSSDDGMTPPLKELYGSINRKRALAIEQAVKNVSATYTFEVAVPPPPLAGS